MTNLFGALTDTQMHVIIGVAAAVVLALAVVIVILALRQKPSKPASQSEEDVQPAAEETIVPDETATVAQSTPAAEETTPAADVQRENPARSAQSSEPITAAVVAEAVREEPNNAATEPRTVVRYNKSFLARLIQSSDDAKRYFAEVANYLVGYGLRKRISWRCVSFFKGREVVARLNVRGKTLCLYLALDPAAYADTKYRVEDASDVKRFEDAPAMTRIRSARAEKYAFELIDELAAKRELAYKAASQFDASDYPYDTTEHLVQRKLIKMKIISGDGNGEIVSGPIEFVAAVTVEEAEELMSDTTAAALVEKRVGEHIGGKKFIVNVDTLSAHFNSGDTVNLQTLKDKKLVPAKEKAVKILARGTLDKALTVEADDFSIDAVKMIALTGGKAIKLD